jgi:hypothetical protein
MCSTMVHDGVMAGGMRRRQPLGSIAGRVEATRSSDSSGPPTTDPGSPPLRDDGPASTVKHCWVHDELGRVPGLLLAWEQTESGFRGRVVRPVVVAGVWYVVEETLPAERLSPATTTGPH